mmetsp:Transcript_105127/g.307227  ORF Transcript_105127/g.307227 Transcript_105127/m.307227 type:complete len:279 (+) Transcript_105127:424-1260(+)
MLMSRGIPSIPRESDGRKEDGFRTASASSRRAAPSRCRRDGGAASASGEDSSPADSVPAGLLLLLAPRLARAPAWRAASASTTATAASAVATADWILATVACSWWDARTRFGSSSSFTTTTSSAELCLLVCDASTPSLPLPRPSTLPTWTARSARPPLRASTTAPATASGVAPDLVTAGTPTVALLEGTEAAWTLTSLVTAGLAATGASTAPPLELLLPVVPLLKSTWAAMVGCSAAETFSGGPIPPSSAGESPGLEAAALVTDAAMRTVSVRTASDI